MSDFKEITDRVDNCVWVEKYKPRTIEDVLLPEDMKEKFREYVKTKNIGTTLFSGTPGNGKTTCAKILAREIAGDNVLFMNASCETSVDTVRNRIEPFCMAANAFDDCLKIVICDEVDGSSMQFQLALKELIEKFYNNVRFIFTSNNPEKIDNAIAKSRCQHFKFGNIPRKDIACRLKQICKTEGIEFDAENVVNMINGIGSDMRQLINELDRLTYTDGDKKKMRKYVSSEERHVELLKIIKGKDWTGARKYINEMELNLDVVVKFLMKPDNIKQLSKTNWPEIAIELGEIAKASKLGVDPEVAFAAGMASFMQKID
jgi:DNA polymerase III delta prime subunit